MIYLHILLISVILVIVTDISDFPNTVKHRVWKFLHPNKLYNKDYRLHLIDCSFCQTWWASLVCIIIEHQLSLYTIAFALVIAYLTPVIGMMLQMVYDFLVNLVNVVYRLLGMQ